ncbi:hypothetical protein T10_7086 [Trichinella papuae]|uniref:Uncharacterized protein n=1 Tax=Trichinella papuae TaxID=268474 RepID=A0A0V1MA19_9BILA|nr:hypothetical protein T10_7086 [Trichinella papuae]
MFHTQVAVLVKAKKFKIANVPFRIRNICQWRLARLKCLKQGKFVMKRKILFLILYYFDCVLIRKTIGGRLSNISQNCTKHHLEMLDNNE